MNSIEVFPTAIKMYVHYKRFRKYTNERKQNKDKISYMRKKLFTPGYISFQLFFCTYITA